jgi:hypothetical protein
VRVGGKTLNEGIPKKEWIIMLGFGLSAVKKKKKKRYFSIV